MRPTPLATVDASWLRMDEPANHMIVTGVMVLEHEVQVERLRQLLEDRLVRFDRFRQRIVEARSVIRVPSWEEDPDFSLDHHLVEVELAPPGGEAALQLFVSGLLSDPFPPGRPLWQVFFLARYCGGSAIVTRIHHCIGDGLALIHVLLSMADGAPEIPRDTVRGDRRDAGRSLAAALAGRARAALPGAVRACRRALGLLADPARLKRSGVEAAAHVGALARLLALAPDPATGLKGPLAVQKKVAWSRPFRLDAFKSVARITGSTVNDVLMAALAGGLRRYLLERGEIAADLSVRSVVPVNLRPAGEAHLLGNRFGLVFLPLPLGIEDPLDRLFDVRRRMREIKRSPQASAIFQLLGAVGAAPRRIFDIALDVFATKATAVVTNVAGPREPISIAGSRLRQAMFWVPSAGHLGLGVSLLSYAGEVWLGIQSDARLVPDPERILAGFDEEVSILLALEAEATA